MGPPASASDAACRARVAFSVSEGGPSARLMIGSSRKQGSKATSRATRGVNDQEFYGGLIRLHVLHHAAQEPVFGLWLIEELQRHGYRIGPGTLYPILHGLERRGLLRSTTQQEGRSVRRMYSATAKGRRTLERAKGKVRELFGEILEDEEVKRG